MSHLPDIFANSWYDQESLFQAGQFEDQLSVLLTVI
jgi:hypothetical protein